jgi:PspA-Associated protein
MIVRILEHGQYRLDDSQHGRLNELDNAVAAAVSASDEAAFRSALTALLDFVRDHGTRVADAELVTSDVVLPHPEITLDEAREAFAGEGAIPG